MISRPLQPGAASPGAKIPAKEMILECGKRDGVGAVVFTPPKFLSEASTPGQTWALSTITGNKLFLIQVTMLMAT